MIKSCVILLCLTLMAEVTDADAQSQILNFLPVTKSLEGAESLSITPSGTIYLVEREKHRLLVMSPDGTRTDSLGARGNGDYRFNNPVSVDATNGLKIYVADKNNGRVQLYDKRFQFLSSISADKIGGTSRFQPSQLQVSSSGDLFVYDSDRHMIYVFDPFGNYRRDIDLRNYRIGSFIHMKIAGSVLMILDTGAGLVHKFTADGGYINFIGGFNGALKIHVTETEIWALFENQVVQFSMQGEPLKIISFSSDTLFSSATADLSTHQNSLYILTRDRLLKAQPE